jgi:hypothetical protein
MEGSTRSSSARALAAELIMSRPSTPACAFQGVTLIAPGEVLCRAPNRAGADASGASGRTVSGDRGALQQRVELCTSAWSSSRVRPRSRRVPDVLAWNEVASASSGRRPSMRPTDANQVCRYGACIPIPRGEFIRLESRMRVRISSHSATGMETPVRGSPVQFVAITRGNSMWMQRGRRLDGLAPSEPEDRTYGPALALEIPPSPAGVAADREDSSSTTNNPLSGHAHAPLDSRLT